MRMFKPLITMRLAIYRGKTMPKPMLTDDYLIRMINQAIAAFLQVIGLKQAGQYQQAQQGIDEALEQLLGLDPHLVRQLDDQSLLNLFLSQHEFDAGRAALAADFFKEEGEIQALQEKPAESTAAYLRALNLYTEVALEVPENLSPELLQKIESLYQQVKSPQLAVPTQLALLDHYERLVSLGEAELAAAGLDLQQVAAAEKELRSWVEPYLEEN